MIDEDDQDQSFIEYSSKKRKFSLQDNEEDGDFNADETVNEEKNKKNYVIEPFSSIIHVNKTIKFPLLPTAITDEYNVVYKTLVYKWKNKFINELNGVLNYFDNLEIIESHGKILDDLPFIYYDIKADFYVFKPQLGEFLKGKISCFTDSNKTISCTTNNYFTVIIKLPEEIPEKLNKYLKLEQEIIFLIENINYSNLIIEGTINKQCLKLMKKNIEIISNVSETIEETNNLDDFFLS